MKGRQGWCSREQLISADIYISQPNLSKTQYESTSKPGFNTASHCDKSTAFRYIGLPSWDFDFWILATGFLRVLGRIISQWKLTSAIIQLSWAEHTFVSRQHNDVMILETGDNQSSIRCTHWPHPTKKTLSKVDKVPVLIWELDHQSVLSLQSFGRCGSRISFGANKFGPNQLLP